MSTHFGWERGQTANYHAEASGPVTVRDCVLIEDPFYVPAWGGWFVMLDRVPGPIPFLQISVPNVDGIPYKQLSLVPDLMLNGLRPPGKSAENRQSTPRRHPEDLPEPPK
jgi:hypothetical protein